MDCDWCGVVLQDGICPNGCMASEPYQAQVPELTEAEWAERFAEITKAIKETRDAD
jgi:hypothetical protein